MQAAKRTPEHLDVYRSDHQHVHAPPGAKTEDYPQGTRDRTNRLTASLRAPLDKDAPRRYAPVDERDPARVRLRRVCSLRESEPKRWALECESLWRDNLPLSKKYAHDFQQSRGADHIPKEDFEQAAAVGLLTAVRRFDPDKAGKLSTYAVWWMRHECEDVLSQEDLVRVPTAVREDRARVLALQAAARETGREVSPEEAAAELDLSVERVTLAIRAVPSRRHAEVDPKRDRDEGSPAPDEDAVRQLREVLDLLPPAERAALADEYGLDEVGEELGTDPVAQRALRELGLRRARRMVREG